MKIDTTVRYLLKDDVLVGSGFTVTHDPVYVMYAGKPTLAVTGFYPGKETFIRMWNPNTTVTIMRENNNG